MGNRRKEYVLIVIYNRFYFVEIQEDVLGTSTLKVEGLTVYQWSVPEKKTEQGV